MKITIAASFVLAIWVLGCDKTVPQTYVKVEEEGKIRCGYDEGGYGDENAVDHHCGITDDNNYCCSGHKGDDPADAECMTSEACKNQQDSLSKIVWRSECDDPADCSIKYPDGKSPWGEGNEILEEKKLVEHWVCCASFAQGHRWSLCKDRADCPRIGGDQTEGCLSSWTCPETFICEEGVYENIFYCLERNEDDR
jgi:hypothetical protein